VSIVDDGSDVLSVCMSLGE